SEVTVVMNPVGRMHLSRRVWHLSEQSTDHHNGFKAFRPGGLAERRLSRHWKCIHHQDAALFDLDSGGRTIDELFVGRLFLPTHLVAHHELTDKGDPIDPDGTRWN